MAPITEDLTMGIGREVERRLEDKDNGDTENERLMLIMLLSIHRDVKTWAKEVKVLYKNPAIKLGKFFQDYPKAAWVVVLVGWVLIGASAFLAVVGFLNATGIQLNVP